MPEAGLGFDPSVDYYQDLGVTQSASQDDVKKAHRRLAKQYHPDSTGGDTAKEQKFKTISVAYNVIGDVRKREIYDQLRAGIGGGGNVFGGYERGANHDFTGNLFDFLNRMRGQAESPRPPRSRAPDTSARGIPRADRRPATPRVQVASDGSSLRVHEFDVHSEVTISFDHALLGTTITVATIEGKADVRIPPGFSSGRKLRLRGKGIVNPRGFTGDHHITVQIEVPDDLDEEEQRLVVQLAEKIRRRKRATPTDP